MNLNIVTLTNIAYKEIISQSRVEKKLYQEVKISLNTMQIASTWEASHLLCLVEIVLAC